MVGAEQIEKKGHHGHGRLIFLPSAWIFFHSSVAAGTVSFLHLSSGILLVIIFAFCICFRFSLRSWGGVKPACFYAIIVEPESKGTFLGDTYVIYFDYSGGYMTNIFFQTYENVFFKRVNFIAC